jgi:uncharacterized OsmC-like protein
MEIFLVVLVLSLLVAAGMYAKKQQIPTVSIKPTTTKEVEPQITDAVTSVNLSMVEDVNIPSATATEVTKKATKKRGRKPASAAKITAKKKVVKGKPQAAPKTPRGRKKKS